MIGIGGGTLTQTNALSDLVVREEIRELTARYALYVDTAQLEPLVDLFTDDVILDETSLGLARSEGREVLASYFAHLFNIVEGMLHLTSNLVFDELASDHARGSCFAIAIALAGGKQQEVTCRYDDEYVRTDGGWKFRSRIITSSIPMDVSAVAQDAP